MSTYTVSSVKFSYTVSSVKFSMLNTETDKAPIQGFVEVAVDREWVTVVGKNGKPRPVPKDASIVNLPVVTTPYTIQCKNSDYGIDINIDVKPIVDQLATLFDQATTDVTCRGQGKKGWWARSDQIYHQGFKFMVWAFEDGRSLIQAEPEADGAWSKLGTALSNVGEQDEAKQAFIEALAWNPGNLDALEGMSKIYAKEDDTDQDEEEASVLARIEELSYLDSDQMNRFGILHYRGKRYHEAIKYWRESASTATHPASLFNLGLAYNCPEVSQDADAVDMWRLALRRLPNYELPQKSLAGVLPRMLNLAANARRQGETLLLSEQWYEHYLNPFELLNPSEDLNLDDFDPKTLQRLKKTLLQEIELEDGAISWMPGVTVDKSRAIGLYDELNDETKRGFHWLVFTNKPLLAFLTKGSHRHFLVDQHESPLATLEILEDEESGFRKWLGDLFAPQYDRVLCEVIESGNLVLLECLLDGRRWVPASHADRCFESARRAINRLIQPLRDANQRSDHEKPTMQQLESLLNHGSMVGVLNLLPSFFEDFQNEVVHQIRGIAVSCFNPHDDIDLSRQVIELAKRFRFRSAHANQQIEEDVAQIEKLIKQERQHEVKLTSGSAKWEITKEGARLGDRFIAAADVSLVRWGGMITGEHHAPVYDFLLSIGADDGRRITFTWKTSQEVERHQKHFQDLINAVINYLLPSLMENVEKRLATKHPLMIGPCKVSRGGVEFEVKGWLITDLHLVPWHRVLVSVNNGEMTIQDAQSPKKMISFSLRDTDNALVLQFLVNHKS